MSLTEKEISSCPNCEGHAFTVLADPDVGTDFWKGVIATEKSRGKYISRAEAIFWHKCHTCGQIWKLICKIRYDYYRIVLVEEGEESYI
jgi:hypothetical protein